MAWTRSSGPRVSAINGRRTERPRARVGPRALAIADANWFTTENLFRDLSAERASTLLLKCLDYRNAWSKGERPWSWGHPLEELRPNLWLRDLVLPTGWMKKFPRLGMRPIARAIRAWHRRLESAQPLTLVMTYPHYLFLRDMVQTERTVYYNLDDYALYWPRNAEQLRALEQRAVRESDLTICVSRLRADELRAAVPEAADRVRHLPHGTPSWSLADRAWDRPAPLPHDIAGLPRPVIGYVGTLEDRVDWPLMTRISQSFPQASIVVVGRPIPPPNPPAPWYDECRRFLARPNVHALGWRPQESIPLYNRAFDVCLIPYRVDHPFNRVCSPTKIMDTMGTGRPIVSTAIPECLLYESLFDVPRDHNEFLAALRSIIDAGSDDGRAQARLEHARRNTCARVADRFLDWLPD
ncbi:MAG: hypothetical protein NVSMB9_18790 [Isosphaeraceae bacterium]